MTMHNTKYLVKCNTPCYNHVNAIFYVICI